MVVVNHLYYCSRFGDALVVPLLVVVAAYVVVDRDSHLAHGDKDVLLLLLPVDRMQ